MKYLPTAAWGPYGVLLGTRLSHCPLCIRAVEVHRKRETACTRCHPLRRTSPQGVRAEEIRLACDLASLAEEPWRVRQRNFTT